MSSSGRGYGEGSPGWREQSQSGGTSWRSLLGAGGEGGRRGKEGACCFSSWACSFYHRGVRAVSWCPAVPRGQSWRRRGGGGWREVGLSGEALTDASCLRRGLMSHCIAILKVTLFDFPRRIRGWSPSIRLSRGRDFGGALTRAAGLL